MTPFVIVRLAALALAASLAACAGIDQRGDTSGPVAAAPSLAVGARWVYRGREGFRAPLVWEETHEVTRIGADGIAVRVTLKGPSLDIEREELLAAPGLVHVGSV